MQDGESNKFNEFLVQLRKLPVCERFSDWLGWIYSVPLFLLRLLLVNILVQLRSRTCRLSMVCYAPHFDTLSTDVFAYPQQSLGRNTRRCYSFCGCDSNAYIIRRNGWRYFASRLKYDVESRTAACGAFSRKAAPMLKGCRTAHSAVTIENTMTNQIYNSKTLLLHSIVFCV